MTLSSAFILITDGNSVDQIATCAKVAAREKRDLVKMGFAVRVIWLDGNLLSDCLAAAEHFEDVARDTGSVAKAIKATRATFPEITVKG